MRTKPLPLDVLSRADLFEGIPREILPEALACMNMRVLSYGAGEIIFLAGDEVPGVGVVCGGEVQVVREDVFGNRTILTKLGPGEIFGETFACARAERARLVKTLPVSVIATTAAEIALLDYQKVVSGCASSCPFHDKLIENMLGILAEKNLMLNRKIEVLSVRTTRAKLLAYLSSQAQRTGNARFKIPFNRQELADYLAVDRSAMSAELGRMRDDGLIRFKHNEFELLKTRRIS